MLFTRPHITDSIRINYNQYSLFQVLSRDFSKELTEYGVEYHVLHEEMSSPRPETKKIKQLETSNKALSAQNKALAEQIQVILIFGCLQKRKYFCNYILLSVHITKINKNISSDIGLL